MKPLCTIVGMGPGVAYGVAKKFGENGYGIAMIARDLKKLTSLELQLKDEGVEAHSFVANAGDENSLIHIFAQIHKELGPTDVLLYNAAVLKQSNILNTASTDVIEDFKVNVLGAIVSVQQVAPVMKEKRKGSILLTGGGLANVPHPAYFSLAIGKAGIRNLTFSLAGELEPLGINVGTVTISGLVKPGSRFSPDIIAAKFWEIHTQKGPRQREIIVQ